MPTEIEIWDLYWSAGLATGIYFAGLAFLIWVSFRAANMVGGTDNMIGKVAVTVFCLTIDWNMLVNNHPLLISSLKDPRKLTSIMFMSFRFVSGLRV